MAETFSTLLAYFLIFAVIVLAHQWYLRQYHPDLPLLCVDHLVDVFLLFFFGWGVFKSAYVLGNPEPDTAFTLGMTIGTLALYAGLGRKDRSLPRRWVVSDEVPEGLRETPLTIAMYIHLASATIIMVTKAASSGQSLWQYFIGDRTSEFLGGSVLEGALLYQVMTITLAAPLMLLWLRAKRRDWKGAAYVFLVLVFSAAAVFVTRLGLILILLLPGFYFYLRTKGSQNRRALAGIALVFVMTLAGLNYWRVYGLSAGDGEGSAAFVTYAALGGVENTTKGYEYLIHQYATGTLNYESGLNYWYTVTTFYPRALWPSKPITSFEGRWTEYVTGEALGSGVVVWTFTAWGEGLAQFGMFGIVLNLFLYGKVLRLAEASLHKPIFLLVWAYYSVLAVTFLRGGFQALFVMTAIFVIPAHIYLNLAMPKPAEERSAPVAATPAQPA